MTTTHHTPGGTAQLAAHRVARIGFGAMQLPQTTAEKAVAVLRHAIDQGVNHIDTAEFYGEANALIRAALHPYPADLALVSKVGAVHEAELAPAQRPEQLRAAVEANLTSLKAESLAVVNLRRLDAPPGIIAQGDQVVDLDSQLAELIALRDEGKIGGIGLSNVDADQLRSALPANIACVQNGYSLLDRAAEAVLDVCREHGIAWVPFFPLGSAFPGIPKTTEHPTVIAAADQTGATPAQISLAWQLSHYANTLLIPGTTNPSHLDENLAAGNTHLDASTIAALDNITST